MRCEICSKEDELVSACIEGSTIRVCNRCSKFGNVISEPASEKKIIKNVIKAEDLIQIVSGYGGLVKKSREKMGLTQDDLAKKINERVSLIQHIEGEKITPYIKLAKKLEKFFEIKLIEVYADPKVNVVNINFKDKGLTIGDLVKLNKK